MKKSALRHVAALILASCCIAVVQPVSAQSLDDTVTFIETFVAGKMDPRHCDDLNVKFSPVTIKYDRKSKKLTYQFTANGAQRTYATPMDKLSLKLMSSEAIDCPNGGPRSFELSLVCATPQCHAGPGGSYNIDYIRFNDQTDASRALEALKHLAALAGSTSKDPVF